MKYGTLVQEILNRDGTLNLPALDARKEKTADALLAESGGCVGIYEQWIAAVSAVP